MFYCHHRGERDHRPAARGLSIRHIEARHLAELHICIEGDVDTATGSNSGLSVLLMYTSTRAGIEPSTFWLKDGPANHWPTVTL